MTDIQLLALARIARAQLPAIEATAGPMLNGDRFVLSGFVLRPVEDGDDGADESGWVFELHVTSQGGKSSVGNAVVKMSMAYPETMDRDEVISGMLGHDKMLDDAEAALAAPIVAYDRDNPPRLPATAFKPGERVMATDPDSGVTHSGTVSEHFTAERASREAANGDVLVFVDDFEYVDGSSLGTLLRADILRLWPARLHRARLLQVATGADLDIAAPCPRPAGEPDDAFRERAIATWVASGMAAE